MRLVIVMPDAILLLFETAVARLIHLWKFPSDVFKH